MFGAKYNMKGYSLNRTSDTQELAIRIRLLPALAFAVPHEVPHLFDTVVQQLPMPQATGLVLYFENTYIERTLPGSTYRRRFFQSECGTIISRLHSGFPGRPILLKHGIAPLMQKLDAIILQYGIHWFLKA